MVWEEMLNEGEMRFALGQRLVKGFWLLNIWVLL